MNALALCLHDIVSRRKAREGVSPADFSLSFRQNVKPEVLERALFYCLDFTSRSVLYTLHDDIQSVVKAPSLYEAQCRLANQIVSVPWDRLPEILLDRPCSPRLVFSVAGCGSKLLVRLLSAIGMPAVSEPQMFAQFHRLPQEEREAHRVAVSAIMRACIEPLVKHCGERVAIKLAPQCYLLARDLLHALPRASVILMLRERRSWAKSSHRTFGADVHSMALTLQFHIKICDWLLMAHADTRVIWYERLTEEPERELRQSGLIEDLMDGQRKQLHAALALDSGPASFLSEQLADREVPPEIQRAFDREWESLRPLEIIERRGFSKLA